MVWLTNGFMLHFYITGGKVHVCRAEGCCTRSTLTVTCSKVRKKKGKPAEDMNLKIDTDASDGQCTCYITSQTPNSCWSNTMDPNIHPQTWRSIFIQHKYRRCVGEPGLCGIRWPRTWRTKLKSHFDILRSHCVVHVNDIPSSFRWSTDGHRNLANIS